MNEHIDERPTIDAAELQLGSSERRLNLVVIEDELVSTHPVPSSGVVRIGRGKENDLVIEHALVSREHAVLTFGADGIDLQDLGSRNGTKRSGERVPPNVAVEVLPGQVIEIGASMILVQESTGALRQRRVATHGYFEARLEEECARARARGAELAVVRFHAGAGIDASAVHGVLSGLLRSTELVASYAPKEWELLVPDGGLRRAESLAGELERRLGHGVRTGIACSPLDGRTADELLLRACADLRGSSTERGPGDEVVVADPAMRDLYTIAARVAKGSISVLLLGETGVGKEVFAEAIHRLSPRRDRKFVRINCAALTESLLESELFGHEKGAFTGADRAKPGLLELADGGTVMLDELGEMPLTTQAKMLRVLEQKQVLRVGGLEPKKIDVRFVSATNRELEAEVIKGAFRRDLFFRLNGVALVIPPLRERTAEIPELAQRFLARSAEELGLGGTPRISPRAMKLLLGYAWPGNIRELRNVMERAVLLAVDGDAIEPEHLPFEKLTLPWEGGADRAEDAVALAPASPGDDGPEADERRKIAEALEACGGNQTRAAKLLGIGRRTLTAKLTRYGMPRPRKSP